MQGSCIALFHGPLFLQAWVVSIAPNVDFELWGHVLEYENIDAPIGEAVKQSVLIHLWYLTPQLIVLSLFDHSLTTRQVKKKTKLSFPVPTF